MYWPEGDTTTDKYNIHHGTITVTLRDKSTPASSYIKRVFDVVKQQVVITYGVSLVFLRPLNTDYGAFPYSFLKKCFTFFDF